MKSAGVLILLCLAFMPACGGAPKETAAPAAPAPAADAAPDSIFTPDELDIIFTMSPLPPVPADPSNRFADNEAAARFGQSLFFDPRLSGNGKVSCATCHNPAKNWTDGKPFPAEFGKDLRHVPSLWNVAYNRWFFWDGRADSLWSQSLDPLENPLEHAGSRWQFSRLVYDDAGLRREYESIFGALPDMSDLKRFPATVPVSATGVTQADRDAVNRVFVNVGKAMAAYQRRIVSRRAPFDVFVEGMKERSGAKRAELSMSAQRGLKLFIGQANCRSCHHGPNFTDGEFHDTGVAMFDPARQDLGRFQGINRLMGSPFNAVGEYTDDSDARRTHPTSFLVNQVDRRGQFKTPTLRNVAVTPPYMHRGQISTLGEVIEFYSTLQAPGLDMSPGAIAARQALERQRGGGHTHGGGGAEHVLTAIHLSKSESDDLMAFLQSLTDTNIDPSLTRPPAPPVK